MDAALDKLVADTKLPDSVEQTKDTMDAVSYTHLDVYKRQTRASVSATIAWRKRA